MLLTTFNLVSARDIDDKILEASKKQGRFAFDQDFRIELFERVILDDNDSDGQEFKEELLRYIRSESKRLKERREFLSEKANQKKGALSADEIREMRAIWSADWRQTASHTGGGRKPDPDALWNALKKDQPLPKTQIELLEIEITDSECKPRSGRKGVRDFSLWQLCSLYLFSVCCIQASVRHKMDTARFVQLLSNVLNAHQ